MRLAILSIFFLSTLAPLASHAQQPNCGTLPDVFIVLDRSGSMRSSSKWHHAKAAVNKLTADFAGQIRFGLMLFPGSSSCAAGRVDVQIADNTAGAITGRLNSTAPGGNTPMAHSLTAARSYLTGLNSGHDKFVILITDGKANCGQSPDSPVAALASSGIKTFVVGFGSGVDPGQLNRLASLGQTALGGSTKYYKADSPTQLTQALQAIGTFVSCCGNGVLDPGEQCDSAITAGPGACPTSAAACDDKNACTNDAVTGAACAATCSHTPVTKAKNGDGCCPPGATSLQDNDCKPACGNGALEAGERCDPGITSGVGACPKTCDDKNACTDDAPTGKDCDVSCQFTPVTKPRDNDGCCPPSANAANDNDCSPNCGNGVLEPGEKCDTAIAAGQTGACPTVCDDNDPCTTDAISGSACNQVCAFTPVTQPKNNDGCCPAAANSLNDNDCKPVCGNGALEAGELCDIKIASGPGKCVEPADCDDQDPCTKDEVVGKDCNAKCAYSQVTPDPLKQDGCCLKGDSLRTDADCPPECTPDRTQNCIDLCQHVACKDGEYCVGGNCRPWPKQANEPGNGGNHTINGLASAKGGCSVGSKAATSQQGLGLALSLLCLLFALRRRRP
jgi:MYXO-CTERM domain-containing protein